MHLLYSSKVCRCSSLKAPAIILSNPRYAECTVEWLFPGPLSASLISSNDRSVYRRAIATNTLRARVSGFILDSPRKSAAV